MSKKRTGRAKCFTRRDRTLVRLGFETYKNYLSSDIWKRIRREILEKRKYACHFCNEMATEVHHTRYSRAVLLGEGKHYPGGLVATCRPCHQMISDLAKRKQIHEGHAFQLFNIDNPSRIP